MLKIYAAIATIFPESFIPIKFQFFSIRNVLTIQGSNRLRASDGIWIQDYENSGLLICRQL